MINLINDKRPIAEIEEYCKSHPYMLEGCADYIDDNKYGAQILLLQHKYCEYPKITADLYYQYMHADALQLFIALESCVDYFEYYTDTLLDMAMHYRAATIFEYILPRYIKPLSYMQSRLEPVLRFINVNTAKYMIASGIKFANNITNVIQLFSNPCGHLLFKLLGFTWVRQLPSCLQFQRICKCPELINMMATHYNYGTNNIPGKHMNRYYDYDDIKWCIWDPNTAAKMGCGSSNYLTEILSLNRFPNIGEYIAKLNIDRVIKVDNFIKLVECGLFKTITPARMRGIICEINTVEIFNKIYPYLRYARHDIIPSLFRSMHMSKICYLYMYNMHSPAVRYIMYRRIKSCNISTSLYYGFEKMACDHHAEYIKQFRTAIQVAHNIIILQPGGLVSTMVGARNFATQPEHVKKICDYYFTRKMKTPNLECVKWRFEYDLLI